MHHLQIVQGFQSSKQLDCNGPQVVLRKAGAFLVMRLDLREQVTLFCVLHHQAQALALHVQERLLILDDVGVTEKSKKAHGKHRCLNYTKVFA